MSQPDSAPVGRTCWLTLGLLLGFGLGTALRWYDYVALWAWLCP